MKYYGKIPVWGDCDEGALKQMETCLTTHESAVGGALMGDHHLGYSCPVGGVIARRNAISPSEVGFDIACGNLAVRTDAVYTKEFRADLPKIMDEIIKQISFGVGRQNDKNVDHPLFYDLRFEDIDALKDLKDLARAQLGTVGSGNHYVDLFHDEQDRIWIGAHFGSRGFGHKIATHYIKAAGGIDGINVPPAVLSLDTDLGREYLQCMRLAGIYAGAGREYVCSTVAKILCASQEEYVHNHHNFAWIEPHNGEDLWVVRKGATPAWPGQKGFVGASMAENAVILQGIESEESKTAFYSTIHGAGRILSRTAAAGKTRWKNGKRVKVSEGCVTSQMMVEWVNRSNVELRGAGVDESPHCYKRLTEVLENHKNTVEILHQLTPIGVAMAGNEIFDPYKD